MMFKRVTGLAAALAMSCALTPALAADFQPSTNAIKAHMGFLASDLLEGRDPGTRGYDIAAAYVAAQFMALGLKPAGDAGSYLQAVPMISYRPTSEGRFSLVGPSGAESVLAFGEDYIPSPSPLGPKTELDAPLVFVGFGIVAPERGRDDYAGLDVKGKIVVYLAGAPKNMQTEERAHYMNSRNKRALAGARGAVGAIAIQTPTFENIFPFSTQRRNWRDLAMTWRKPDGRPFYAGAPLVSVATMSPQGAAKLFAGAKIGFERVIQAAESPAGDPPRFDLKTRAKVAFDSEIKTIDSANVAALIEGSDPVLKREVVVLSAHLDHFGVGAPINGDSIYNGAVDNAAGVATTLEVARGFKEGGTRPKRSLLFLIVTGEERGLLGSDYFANNPTVPLADIVADVDLDMPMLSYDFTDVVAFGAERSDVGPAVRRAAARLGVALSPDPEPDQGNFTRSDHYRFVEKGIPAVFLMTGYANGGRAAVEAFQTDRYHKPNDDMAQPLDFGVAAKYARLNYEITKELGDLAERPRWNKGDFFGTLFKGPMAP